MKKRGLVFSNVVPIKQNYIIMDLDGGICHTEKLPADLDKYAAVIDSINNTQWVSGLWLPLCRLGDD